MKKYMYIQYNSQLSTEMQVYTVFLQIIGNTEVYYANLSLKVNIQIYFQFIKNKKDI